MTEVRSVSSSGAEKGVKQEAFDLLPPVALAKVAAHYGIGAGKYAPWNWRRGYEWSKSYAAMQRHANAFWGGEDIDAETGSPHMAAVAFHALTLLTFMDEHTGFDDRYKGADAAPAAPAGSSAPIGTVYSHGLPTVAGYYTDSSGDLWEHRPGDPDQEWSIARYKGRLFKPLSERDADFDADDARAWMPLTRVEAPVDAE